MSFTPHAIGTLIVVVLKAKNLPNKKHIGKQAPYCSVTLNEVKLRTKVIRRGGQHPEWDEEFRFTIFEDVEAGLVRSAPGSVTPPPLPPKRRGPKRIQGGNFMMLQCYADDARDPDFIGETLVDLTEALTRGETDEWFTLMNKDKYAGEVYLELTFWSNEPPPEKKSSRRPTMLNKNYGGPGSFVPADGNASLNGNVHPATRRRPASAVHQLDSLPSSLRASGSPPELYAPPYEQRNVVSPVEQMANDFAELGMVDHRSQDNCATLRPPTSIGVHTSPLSRSRIYEQQSQIEESNLVHDDAVTPPASHPSFSTSYYPTYEGDSVSGPPPPPRNHGPRYSMPTSSSGFVPVSSIPSSSSYASVSYSPELPAFSIIQGHPSHPPSPNPPTHTGYSPHHTHPGYTAVPPVPTPLMALPPPLPSPHTPPRRITHSTLPFPTQSMEYSNLIPPVHSAPPQKYPVHAPATPSPPSEIPPPTVAPSSSTIGSRPLPQPGQFQRDRRYSTVLPPSSSFPRQVGGGFPNNRSFSPVPPAQYRRTSSVSGYPALPESTSPHLPPFPALLTQVQGNHPSRPPALSQPLVGYHPIQPAYQPLPPPPPLVDIPQHPQLPLSISSSLSNTSHFQGLVQGPPQPYPNYGQPLPTPPPLHGGWE